MPEPLRILYVLNDLGGGASLGVYEMLRGLPRDRFLPFAVAAPGSLGAYERMRPLFEDVRLFPIPWWNTTRHLGAARQLAIRVSELLRGSSQRACRRSVLSAIHDWRIDLVHSATSLTLGGAAAAHDAGLPHLWHVKESIGRNGRVQFRLPDAALVRFIGNPSAFVVAMSEFVARPFREHACPNLEVLPDGVDTQPFVQGSSRNLRSRLGVRTQFVLVGMVASLTSTWKEHEVFIRAAALVAATDDRCRFVLIGPKPRAHRWPHDLAWRRLLELEALVRRLGLTERLQFLDFVPDPPDIMRSLDVLVHPCSQEPFGRIAIEAMAAGTPTVGPRTGGIAEIILDEQTGLLVEPRSPEAFAQAIRRLLLDPGLRHRLGEAGKVRSRQAFSLASHVERQARLYSRAVLRRSEAPGCTPAPVPESC